MNKSFETVEYETADELWDALSPTRELVKEPCKLLYRGQENSDWGLIPSVLRKGASNPATAMWGEGVNADNQVFTEIQLLKMFAEFCDQVGIRIPGDSMEFREMYSLASIKIGTIYPQNIGRIRS